MKMSTLILSNQKALFDIYVNEVNQTYIHCKDKNGKKFSIKTNPEYLKQIYSTAIMLFYHFDESYKYLDSIYEAFHEQINKLEYFSKEKQQNLIKSGKYDKFYNFDYYNEKYLEEHAKLHGFYLALKTLSDEKWNVYILAQRCENLMQWS